MSSLAEQLQQATNAMRLRTRGRLDRRKWTFAAEDLSNGAEALIGALRKDLDGLPLCITSYVNADADAGFAREAMKYLSADDTLWLVQTNPQVDLSSVKDDSAFVLDLRNPVHEEAS